MKLKYEHFLTMDLHIVGYKKTIMEISIDSRMIKLSAYDSPERCAYNVHITRRGKTYCYKGFEKENSVWTTTMLNKFFRHIGSIAEQVRREEIDWQKDEIKDNYASEFKPYELASMLN